MVARRKVVAAAFDLDAATGLHVPALDSKPWPTLGPQVCEWIEEHLVFGPGDLKGEPMRLDDEKRALIYRAYEVHPKGTKTAGRRRFQRVAFSARKGSAKTELAAAIAAAELDGPVRTDFIEKRSGTLSPAFDRHGEPIGCQVRDPYIPMVAYTEEQSEELVYGALLTILELSDIADHFDIGLERIIRIGPDGRADGKVVAVAGAPNSRDGARTTFQSFDETGRFTLKRLKDAHRTMLANAPKRMLADAWSLETTTAPVPGERSVAEETIEYARQVKEGRVKDPKLFFFHRQASNKHDLTTKRGVRAAVLEASGPVAAWSNIDAICAQWEDPTADRAYLERMYLNRLVKSRDQAFDSKMWAKRAKPGQGIPDGALVTLGFDGARYFDSSGLVATEILTGHQIMVGKWERPFANEKSGEHWEVPEEEVTEAVYEAFERWEVYRFYADPPYWESTVAKWAGEKGEKIVIAWPTARTRAMSNAVRAYVNAIAGGDVSHDGDPDLARHIGNCHKRWHRIVDDKGKPLYSIQKEREGSPNKIDFAMAGILSWEGRLDAIAAGVQPEPEESYEVTWV